MTLALGFSLLGIRNPNPKCQVIAAMGLSLAAIDHVKTFAHVARFQRHQHFQSAGKT
jgi:hypothetical protein